MQNWATYLAAAFFVLLRLLENVVFSGSGDVMNGDSGSTLYQATLLFACTAVIVSMRPWTDIRRLLVLPISVVAALAWCWLSIAWSIAPDIAARRIGKVTLFFVAVFAITDELGYDRTLNLLRWTFASTLVLCYILVFADPGIGIEHQIAALDPNSIGTWRGVFVDKNACGAFCATTILLFLFDARTVKPAFRYLAILATVFFLIKSQSKTSMGALLVCIAFGAALTQYNRRYRLLLAPLALCAGAAALITWRLLLAPFQSALYDTSAFTGRGPIWATLLLYLREHWLLGAGFGSFWAVPNSPVYRYSDASWVRDTVRIGHNGYLDIWATIGLPGLVLVVVAALIIPMVRIFTDLRLSRGRIAVVGSILLFAAIDDVTESALFHEKALLSVILMFAMAMSRDRAEPQRKNSRRRKAARSPADRRPGGPIATAQLAKALGPSGG